MDERLYSLKNAKTYILIFKDVTSKCILYVIWIWWHDILIYTHLLGKKKTKKKKEWHICLFFFFFYCNLFGSEQEIFFYGIIYDL